MLTIFVVNSECSYPNPLNIYEVLSTTNYSLVTFHGVDKRQGKEAKLL